MEKNTKNKGLIGHTGFVGSNILKQCSFKKTYNSNNISEIKGEEFDLLVCSGIRAVKWWSNQNPEEDRTQVAELLQNLRHVRAEKAVLISTVDVYANPYGVNEDDSADFNNHPYGTNRRMAERFFAEHFENSLIVRLPGLFGEGLKKNVIFDLINKNNIDAINPLSKFQYYDLSSIWEDLKSCIESGVRLINFATHPIGTWEIMGRFFPDVKIEPKENAVCYDMHTKHADIFSKDGSYIQEKDEVFRKLERFIKCSQ